MEQKRPASKTEMDYKRDVMRRAETKADWIDDICPRCRGTGADPDQSGIPRKLPDGTIQVSADCCRQCGGTGRMPKSEDS
jgi:hypothetical protein